MRLRYRSASRSHVGLVRTENEDAMLARDDAALWAVADGMGGHANGRWASQTLVAHLAALDLRIDRDARGLAIVQALEAANQMIHQAATAAAKQMGTTAVVVHADRDDLLLIWIGDSRIYRLRDGVLTQMTRDHTLVQDLVDRGTLRPDEAESHPMSHVLNRAVGIEPVLRYEATVDKVAAGDRYLLCSDGLTKCVSDALLTAIVAMDAIEAAIDSLMVTTINCGAPDNTTVVVLMAEESTAVTTLSTKVSFHV